MADAREIRPENLGSGQPSNKAYEMPKQAVEKGIRLTTLALETVGNILRGIWDGAIDAQQDKVDRAVEQCLQLGLVFGLKKIGEDENGKPKYRVVVEYNQHGQDAQIQNAALKKERDELIAQINAPLASDLDPARQNKMIAQAVRKHLAQSLAHVGSGADTLHQRAAFAFDVSLTQLYNKEIIDGKLQLDAAALNEVFRRHESGCPPITPEMQSFVNLFKDGEGIIDSAENYTNVTDPVIERVRMRTRVEELRRNGAWEGFIGGAVQEGKKNVLALPQGYKLLLLAGTVWGLVSTGEWGKRFKWALGIFFGSDVMSRVLTGKDLFNLVGALGDGTTSFWKDLMEGRESEKIKRFIRAQSKDKASVSRVLGLGIVGSLRVEDVLNAYNPATHSYDIQQLPEDQKKLVEQLKNTAVNPREDVARDFDAQDAISDALTNFFQTVGNGNIQKGYDIVKGKYTGVNAVNWTLQGQDIRFITMVMHYVSDELPGAVQGWWEEKTGSAGGSTIRRTAAEIGRKGIEGSDGTVLQNKFAAADIMLAYGPSIDHSTPSQEVASRYSLGGWPIKLVPDGNKLTIEFYGMTNKLEIGDINTIQDSEKRSLQEKIQTIAQDRIGVIEPLKNIVYNLGTGEYKAEYTYSFQAADGTIKKEKWDLTFNFTGAQFWVKEMRKGTEVMNMPGTFDPATGQVSVPMVDTTASGAVQGYPLTASNIEAVLTHADHLKNLNNVLANLPVGMNWNNVRKNSTGSWTIEVAAGVVLEADKDFTSFNFAGDPSGKFDITVLRERVEKRLNTTDVLALLTRRLEASGYKVKIHKDPAENPTHLELTEYQVKIPITQDPNDPDIGNKLYVNPTSHLVEKLYGNPFSYAAADTQEKFLIPVLEKELLGGDAGFKILSVQGSEVKIRYDITTDRYAPSFLYIDMNDLKRIKKVDGAYMTRAEYDRDIAPNDNLTKKLEPLKNVLKVFAGYEIKEFKQERTMQKNHGQLVQISLKIGSYEEKTDVDRPKDRMLWSVMITYDIDNAGNPAAAKSIRVQQLDGNPVLEASTDAEWNTMEARGIQTMINDKREQRLKKLEAVYASSVSPFSFTDVEQLYNSFNTGRRDWLINKDELHAIHNAGSDESIPVDMVTRAETCEQNFDNAVTGIVGDLDYTNLFSGFDAKYTKYLTDTKPNVSQRAVRYLLMRRFIELSGSATSFASYDDSTKDKLLQVHNISEEEAQLFLKHPAMVEMYAQVLVNPFEIDMNHFHWSWTPRWLNDFSRKVNYPPFTDTIAVTGTLMEYMDHYQFPTSDQLEIQEKLIQAVQRKDAGAIADLCNEVQQVAEARTWYTTPTAYSRSATWFGEKWSDVKKYFISDK